MNVHTYRQKRSFRQASQPSNCAAALSRSTEGELAPLIGLYKKHCALAVGAAGGNGNEEFCTGVVVRILEFCCFNHRSFSRSDERQRQLLGRRMRRKGISVSGRNLFQSRNSICQGCEVLFRRQLQGTQIIQTSKGRLSLAAFPFQTNLCFPNSAIMDHDGPPAKDHLRRDARDGRAWRADLLCRLSLKPQHRDQRRGLARRSQALRY
jgi:hypothetical protein